MNREHLKILRDHLASLPDERVDMSIVHEERDCGTVACITGWSRHLFGEGLRIACGLSGRQALTLMMPDHGERHWMNPGDYTRTDAVAAIDSMLANPDDDALPVWPEKAVAA